MKISSPGRNFIPNALVLILGLILLIPSAGKIYAYYTFSSQAVRVYGVVDKTPPKGGAGLGGRPLVQYEDFQGNRHVIKSTVKTHFFVAPKKGEAITVLYLKEDPRAAMVDSTLHHIVIPLLFIVAGAAAVYRSLKNCWFGMTAHGRSVDANQ